MKRKTILFGSILSIFLILIIPNVSAIEFNIVEDVFEEKYEKINFISNIKINILQHMKKLIQISVPLLIITFLNIIAFILSVIIGTIIITAIDNPIAGMIAAFPSVFPLYIVVKIAEKIATNDMEESIATVEYCILCFLLGVILGGIRNKIS